MTVKTALVYLKYSNLVRDTLRFLSRSNIKRLKSLKTKMQVRAFEKSKSDSPVVRLSTRAYNSMPNTSLKTNCLDNFPNYFMVWTNICLWSMLKMYEPMFLWVHSQTASAQWKRIACKSNVTTHTDTMLQRNLHVELLTRIYSGASRKDTQKHELHAFGTTEGL